MLVSVAVIAVAGLMVWRSTSTRESWLVGRDGDIAYASDACRAFAPSGRWNGSTVFLNAGHGGADPGAVTQLGDAGVTEKALTLAIAEQTVPLLRDAGYRVVVSRSADSSVAVMRRGDVRNGALTPAAVRRDIVARVSCANASDADILVSMHLNSYRSASAAGAQTFYNPNRDFSAQNRTLALHLQRSIVASMRRSGWQIRDRGIKTDTSAGAEAITREAAAYDQLLELGPAARPWFTTPSRMPGAVIEPLFLTNPDEARRVMSEAGRAAIARGILAGVQSYFDASR